MLIFALDDEFYALNALVRSIEEAVPDGDIRRFQRPSAMIKAMEEEGIAPDLAFLDVEMPGMTGLEAAKIIKQRNPRANLVFVTGFVQYALDAIPLHPSGYIVKPATAEEIRAQVNNLQYPPMPSEPSGKGLQARCFGEFDVFYDGAPITFRHEKTKEMLAYLVDRRGSGVDAARLCAILWKERPNSFSRRMSLRALVSDLRGRLASVDCQDALVVGRDSFAVNMGKWDCDYYRFLRGDMRAVNSYRGEYMRQYAWPELSVAARAEE